MLDNLAAGHGYETKYLAKFGIFQKSDIPNKKNINLPKY
jgi:hypothetical protein